MLSIVNTICIFTFNFNKWVVYTFVKLVKGLFYTIWSLINGIIIVPLSITLRCFIYLATLPINIPLYIITGKSIESIIKGVSQGINIQLITIVFQYSLALMLTGMIIGTVTGFMLGFIHIHTYLRDHILEFHVRAAIKRVVGTIVSKIKNNITLWIHALKDLIQRKYSETSFANKSSEMDESESTISLNDAMRQYVSSLPKEFFQWINSSDTTSKSSIQVHSDKYDATTMKNDEHIPYISPPGSPKLDSLDLTELPIDLFDSSDMRTSTLKHRKRKY